jgi:hypothetical protein
VKMTPKPPPPKKNQPFMQSTLRMGLGSGMLTAAASFLHVQPAVLLAGLVAVVVAFIAKFLIDKPSRTFTEAGVGGTVGNEYDAWTEEGILEYYWGEHIHLGYYDQSDLDAITNPLKSGKVFKDTKFKFIEEMYKWSGAEVNSGGAPPKILDVGCGIGGIRPASTHTSTAYSNPNLPPILSHRLLAFHFKAPTPIPAPILKPQPPSQPPLQSPNPHPNPGCLHSLLLIPAVPNPVLCMTAATNTAHEHGPAWVLAIVVECC